MVAAGFSRPPDIEGVSVERAASGFGNAGAARQNCVAWNRSNALVAARNADTSHFRFTVRCDVLQRVLWTAATDVSVAVCALTVGDANVTRRMGHGRIASVAGKAYGAVTPRMEPGNAAAGASCEFPGLDVTWKSASRLGTASQRRRRRRIALTQRLYAELPMTEAVDDDAMKKINSRLSLLQNLRESCLAAREEVRRAIKAMLTRMDGIEQSHVAHEVSWWCRRRRGRW